MAIIRRSLLIFAAALALTACSGSDTPEAVAESFIKASYNNDPDTVYKLIAVPADADDGTEEMVRGKLKMAVAKSSKNAEALGGVDEIKAAEASYNDDKTQASTTVTITFKKDGARERSESVRLDKVDGEWKVHI